MDTFKSTYNGTYNEAFSIMNRPLIRFPEQDDYLHRQVVILKCFMLIVMENKEIGRTLLQRLQHHLSICCVTFAFVMMALSSELVRKAIPLVLFWYSCRTLKFLDFESNLRRCISFVFHVLCCIAVAGYEFIFDVYFIVCFLGMSLYSLYLRRDHLGNDRGTLQRASVILVFFIEVALMYYSHVIDYMYTLFVNAALTLNESAVGLGEMHVASMYTIMSQFLHLADLMEFDIDANFTSFMHAVWEYVIQSLGIV